MCVFKSVLVLVLVFFVIVIGLFVCLTLNAPSRTDTRGLKRPRPPGDSPRPQTILNTPPYVVIVSFIPCNTPNIAREVDGMLVRWEYVEESERKQVEKLKDTQILDTRYLDTGNIQKV